METPDDTLQLLKAWQEQNDEHALNALLERHLGFLQRKVRSAMGEQLRGQLETMDIVQEVALDVMRYGPRYLVEEGGQLRALLARMVENNLRDRARWHGAERRDARRQQALSGASVDLRAPQPGPRTALLDAERSELVRLAVELLDDRDRTVVRLRQLEGRPMSEVAEMLELTPQTAHMRYQRALPRLALRMQELLRGEVPLVE